MRSAFNAVVFAVLLLVLAGVTAPASAQTRPDCSNAAPLTRTSDPNHQG